MKKLRKFVAFAMALTACCTTANVSICNAKPVSALTIIAGISDISVRKNIIAVGESVQAELEWSTGAKQDVFFESSDESVATVDDSGVITGISDGTAVITVSTANSASARTLEITVSSDVIPSVYYNTSELVPGQKLNQYDVLHYDNKNLGGWANVVTEDGDYEIAFISEGDYVLPFNAEVVGFDGTTLYIAPKYEYVKYIDARMLTEGDVIDRNAFLLCYDYVTNGRVLPVFLPKYYDEYIGDGTVTVESIDHEKKRITLEAVPKEAVAGDSNGDGEFGVADVLMLQKWLMGAGELTDWRNADLNNDGQVDVFDFCLMRSELLANPEILPEISMSDIIDLSRKDSKLSWRDFAGYKHEDVGSGFCIWVCPIKGSEDVLTVIGGGGNNEIPNVTLETNDDRSIDIYSEEFEQFIKENGYARITVGDIIEIAKKGDEITWDDFKGYNFTEIGSGFLILEFPIEDNYGDLVEDVVLVVGGSPGDKPDYILLVDTTGEEESIDIRGEEFKIVIDLFENGFGDKDPENDETNQANARKIGEYYLSELEKGNCTTETTIWFDDITDDEISEAWDERVFLCLEFVDEHTALLRLNAGLLDAYGYLITDGTVEYELGDVSVLGKGYDGGVVWVEWKDGNLCYFSAGT
ncbi:MAG: dockerin type I domain-containing protein [Ruminococcus flavefaciens]|nr:dockerin type I domain-containing protein [Ruminococcus flavefaciens]MCM1229869.1 dockerin type I domain-containing protein [Ruminococcus flavefaciens]